MKIRVRFSKFDRMKFVGHLDLMRFFQKAMIRANWPLLYSKGFNPHPILSFALPLGVGVISKGEYMDVSLENEVSVENLISSIQKTLPLGIEVLSIEELSESSKNAMASLFAASYEISYNNDKFFDKFDYDKWIDFMDCNDNIVVTKKSKKSERQIDIKPLIFEYDKTSDNNLYLKLSSGSKDNISPYLCMEAFMSFLNAPFNQDNFTVCRLDMYFN